jgi:hypothetical protein
MPRASAAHVHGRFRVEVFIDAQSIGSTCAWMGSQLSVGKCMAGKAHSCIIMGHGNVGKWELRVSAVPCQQSQCAATICIVCGCGSVVFVDWRPYIGGCSVRLSAGQVCQSVGHSVSPPVRPPCPPVRPSVHLIARLCAQRWSHRGALHRHRAKAAGGGAVRLPAAPEALAPRCADAQRGQRAQRLHCAPLCRWRPGVHAAPEIRQGGKG